MPILVRDIAYAMLILMPGHLIWCIYSSAKLLVFFSFVLRREIDFCGVLTIIKAYRS